MEGDSFLGKTYFGKHSKVVSGFKTSLVFILPYICVRLSFIYVCFSVRSELITFLSLGNILKAGLSLDSEPFNNLFFCGSLGILILIFFPNLLMSLA